jgi:cysteine desulfurase/selenocysteine lyase
MLNEVSVFTMPIYLDNAATTFPKPETVYQAVDRALRQFGVNPGRGSYRLALEAGRLVLEAREAVAEFFHIPDSSRVVFTSNATEAINMALFGLVKPGDRVITSTMEHNAVSRPLHYLAAHDVEVVRVPADSIGQVSPAAIREAVSTPGRKTHMVVLSHCSNVTGTIQPIEEIGAWCRREGILLLVDAAQSAGVLPINVQTMDIDLLAAPGHKSLLGPPGTGLLYIAEGLQPAPMIFGGTGGNSLSPSMPEELPERLESGTLNTPGLAGLTAGINYVCQQGLERIHDHKVALLDHLLHGLRALPGTRIYGPAMAERHGGAVSFTVDGRDPAEIGYLLDDNYEICVRTGLHCAADAHRTIGTLPSGTIRVSPGLFNTQADIEALLTALKTIIGQN